MTMMTAAAVLVATNDNVHHQHDVHNNGYDYYIILDNLSINPILRILSTANRISAHRVFVRRFIEFISLLRVELRSVMLLLLLLLMMMPILMRLPIFKKNIYMWVRDACVVKVVGRKKKKKKIFIRSIRNELWRPAHPHILNKQNHRLKLNTKR